MIAAFGAVLAPCLNKIYLAAAALVLCVVVVLYVGRLDAQLATARAVINADSEKCAATQLAAAAGVDAAAQAVIDGQQINLDAAQGALSAAGSASQAAGAATAATINAAAAQPGQDGALAPVSRQTVAAIIAVQRAEGVQP